MPPFYNDTISIWRAFPNDKPVPQTRDPPRWFRRRAVRYDSEESKLQVELQTIPRGQCKTGAHRR